MIDLVFRVNIKRLCPLMSINVLSRYKGIFCHQRGSNSVPKPFAFIVLSTFLQKYNHNFSRYPVVERSLMEGSSKSDSSQSYRIINIHTTFQSAVSKSGWNDFMSIQPDVDTAVLDQSVSWQTKHTNQLTGHKYGGIQEEASAAGAACNFQMIMVKVMMMETPLWWLWWWQIGLQECSK